MDQSVNLIALLATGFGLALFFGYIANYFKIPTLVGYLFAGVFLGPFTPGYIGDQQLANQLAEIGVVLLMFGVGLHFSLNDLDRLKKTAIPTAILNIFIITLISAIISVHYWGYSVMGGVILGLCLSVSSTVVLVRALEKRDLVTTDIGKFSIGRLVVEDIIMILVLVFLPVIFQVFIKPRPEIMEQSLTEDLMPALLALLKIIIFIFLMFFLGRKILPKILKAIVKTESRELFTLAIVSAAVSISFFSAKFFEVSMALGAFFAGTIFKETEYSKRAELDSLPLRDLFSVLFFVSIGMLFNPLIIILYPYKVLIIAIIVVIVKLFATTALCVLFKYPFKTALVIGCGLAQIGEFSFILASMGLQFKLISKNAYNLILVGAFISIALNPTLFKLSRPFLEWYEKKRRYFY
ncbi:RosB Kef-type K+ transport system, predicted NAD-binding component [Candidatus Pelagibacterales bacterium]